MQHSMRIAAVGAAAALILAMSACGSGGGGETGHDDHPSGEATAEPKELTAEQEKACDAMIAATENFLVAIQSESPALPPELSEKMIANFTAIKEGTTGAASTAAGDVASTLEEASSTDNWALLEDESFFQNWMAAGIPGRDMCGFAPVDVEAQDVPAKSADEHPEFHYMGIPDTLGAGDTSIRLDNPSDSFHDLMVLKVNEDYTDSVDEFAKLDMAGQMGAGTPVALTFAPPHGEGYANLDLTKGRYFVVCSVPLTDGEGPEAPPLMGPNGPITHASLGMAEEVTVN